jgi:hypothetical protein
MVLLVFVFADSQRLVEKGEHLCGFGSGFEYNDGRMNGVAGDSLMML